MVRKAGLVLVGFVLIVGIALSQLPAASAQEVHEEQGKIGSSEIAEGDIIEHGFSNLEEYRKYMLSIGVPVDVMDIRVATLQAVFDAAARDASWDEIDQIADAGETKVEEALSAYPNLTLHVPDSIIVARRRDINASCGRGAQARFSYVSGQNYNSDIVQASPPYVHTQLRSCQSCSVTHTTNTAASYAYHSVWVSGLSPSIFNHTASCR